MRTFLLSTLLLMGIALTGCSEKDLNNINPNNWSKTPALAFDSKILKEQFSLHISLPALYDPQKKYPVIYLLDADTLFPMVSQYTQLNSHDEGAQEVIVVGIGYTSLEAWKEGREKHYYPSENNNTGAAAFSKFLSSELFPFIEQKYAVDSSSRILYGHSAGGLFSIYAYLTTPDLFQSIIASSPILSWNNQWFFNNLSNQDAENISNLFISFGDAEVVDMKSTEDYLSSKKIQFTQEKLSYRVFAGYKHMGVIPVSLASSIQWALLSK